MCYRDKKLGKARAMAKLEQSRDGEEGRNGRIHLMSSYETEIGAVT